MQTLNFKSGRLCPLQKQSSNAQKEIVVVPLVLSGPQGLDSAMLLHLYGTCGAKTGSSNLLPKETPSAHYARERPAFPAKATSPMLVTAYTSRSLDDIGGGNHSSLIPVMLLIDTYILLSVQCHRYCVFTTPMQHLPRVKYGTCLTLDAFDSIHST